MTDFERLDRILNMTTVFPKNCPDQEDLVFIGKAGILHMKERNIIV